MTLRHICLFLLAFLVAGAVAQNEDELHIPVENDNQFPPDNHSELDGNVIEGSGAGVVEEPVDATTLPSVPLIEDVQSTSLTDNEQPGTTDGNFICPKPCLCNTEGGSNNFVVDCAGYDLTEFPTELDSRTTTLNLQNNKITKIPKEISSLKNLQVLNVYNNSITELVSGSISELPELTVLKLGNNRLIEYPIDLKNGFGLTKLAELDLGSNDMRTTLTSETFSNFKSLRQLTLPSSTTVLVEDLCRDLKDSLENVCTVSCSEHAYECPEAPETVEDDLLSGVLPGTIALTAILGESIEPAVQTPTTTKANTDAVVEKVKETVSTNSAPVTVSEESSSRASEPTSSSPLNKTPEVSQMNSLIETPAVTASGNESDVAVGATTAGTKTGGVDKSVIGMIVAGMVLVVAGITIKKNWSSIKNRFSSQRPPHDRAGANANGTTPEEVPLQEKSPV